VPSDRFGEGAFSFRKRRTAKMSLQTISIARSQVLGNFNARCEKIELIPVYMSEDMETQIGFVDQSLGPYADAFSFHLPADMCKRLSSGQFSFSFGYDDKARAKKGNQSRITLNYICLTTRQPVR
jgi:hypothetical protein